VEPPGTPQKSEALTVSPDAWRGVIGVEIVIVESQADRIDPELVRHVP
jgi:hypothetical protein